MKRARAPRPLAEGVKALARAARVRPRTRTRAKGPAFLLPGKAGALRDDEILIAVADAGSLALRRVKMPRPLASRPGGVAELARRVAEIDLVAAELAGGAGLVPAPALTAAEDRLLRDAGLDPRPLAAGEAHLVHRATAEYARLLSDSLTVDGAARVLGVNASRIRQRLSGRPRSLYGIKAGKGWRVPKFQFLGRRVVPGLERVVAHLPADLHPVAVYRWFTSPNADLEADDGTPMAPLDWLRTGRPHDPVVDLAAQL